MHNLGHAAQLIQTSGMNILTDPVFGNLAQIVYPSMTKGFGKNFQAKDLPHIDVILISHNHRDHVDVASLRQLIKKAQDEGRPLPQLLVPMGDEDFFKELGFTDVKAFEWHEQITFYSKTKEPVSFCSTPADHRFGVGKVSTIIPDTSFTDKHGNVRCKGEKFEDNAHILFSKSVHFPGAFRVI